MRVEKIIKITADREPSDKYISYGWAFDFEDEEGNKYEWNTKTFPDDYIKKGQKWLVRMTIDSEHETLGHKYKRVSRVKFIRECL